MGLGDRIQEDMIIMFYSRHFKKRKNKYGNKRIIEDKVCINGVWHDAIPAHTQMAGFVWDSILERARAVELCLLQDAGEISDLQFHPTLHLTRSKLQYTPDFRYRERGAPPDFWTYEEVKGAATYPWITYRQLWPEYGPGKLLVLKNVGGWGRVILRVVQIIMPKPAR